MVSPRGRSVVTLFSAVSVLVTFSALSTSAVSLQPGWPQTTAAIVYSSPTLGDMDGDGDLEVVIGSDDFNVYAWHHDGALVAGWPKTTGNIVGSSPALGDLDRDGQVEVVVGSGDNNVYAWHRDGTAVAGWPQATGSGVASSPALGDLDGDGDLEVVVGSDDFKVYAWHHDGTLVAGWPQATGNQVVISPALGDLDGDGDLEVVIGSSDGNVYAWHHDGSPVTGWPQHLGDYIGSSPALGDLDGDGELEVVAASYYAPTVYVWRHDGSTVEGWPQNTPGGGVQSSPALGDLDGDGHLEVVIGSANAKVYAWHHDGTSVAGWPQATGDQVGSSPALGDLDGDGKLEVVVGSWDRSIHAWHADGSLVTGWPQATGEAVLGSPTLGDLDGDGDVEVVIGSYDHKVYAWSCDTLTDDLLPWPMFRHDLLHSGWYECVEARFAAVPARGIAPLPVSFVDEAIGRPASWLWDFGDGTTATAQGPVHEYAHEGTYTVSLTVTAAGRTDTKVESHSVLVTFTDVPFSPPHWALHEILACVDAGIVQGYDGGVYAPAATVTRDQMAVYIARSIATPTGDSGVPDGPATATFEDVPNTGFGHDGTDPYWAYKYIEYCVARDVVRGYNATEYRPTDPVTRDQMAVFVARARGWVGIDDDMTTAPEVFPDVPAGHWAGTAIQACVTHSVVQGYDDGKYHPEYEVARDQMAVYVQRAFRLPM